MISGFLARATWVPVPLVQIALGALIYYSSLTSVVLNPEVFFLLFLPPLLFLDGWRIPKDSLFRDASTILKLALGLVVFTVLGMGLFIHWLIPSLPLAVSFALAAVISPTDPIAASAIAATHPEEYAIVFWAQACAQQSQTPQSDLWARSPQPTQTKPPAAETESASE